MINIAVFISGRGSNFKALNENIKNGTVKGGRISVVFSNNPSAEGLKYAEQEGIPVIVISSKGRQDREVYDREVIEKLSSYNIDLICLAGYMRIVTMELVSAYNNRIMNIHPSLLPSFPGLHAQAQALEYGVKQAGCTVHFVDGGMDTGPIILQKSVEVLDDDNEDSLSERILKEEHKLYSEAVNLFCNNRLMVEGRRVKINGGVDE